MWLRCSPIGQFSSITLLCTRLKFLRNFANKQTQKNRQSDIMSIVGYHKYPWEN